MRLPEGVRTIPAALAYWATRAPDAPALRALDGRAWSRRALQDAVAGAAAVFGECGPRPGEQTAFLLQGGAETCIALLAAMSVGVAVPLYPGSTAAELRRDLKRLDTRLLVTGGPPAATGRAVAAELGIPALGVEELAASHPLPATPLSGPGDPESIAAVLHTSGTTGLPKRVLRSHRSFVAVARAADICTSLTEDDVLLLTSGMYSNMGLANLCAALCSGGSVVLAPAFDPMAYPAWLEEQQPTWTVSTAAELNLLLAAAEASGRPRIAGPRSRLRIVRAGAQPMTPGTDRRAEQSLRALIFDGFGMTEASYITGSGPTVADRRAGSVGPPLLSEIRVLDDEVHDLPPGQPGAIVIRGATLFSGYLDDAAATAAALLPGGWFRTGDLGYLDADGYLYLIGRFNELINRGGEKIAPVEVERALLTHPAVAEAAAFPVADDRLGEDIAAAVVLKPGANASARELRGWMLDRLSTYKTPRRIWFVDRLPRTSTGKVQRGELSRRWEAERRP